MCRAASRLLISIRTIPKRGWRADESMQQRTRSARSVRPHRYPLPAESGGTRCGFSRAIMGRGRRRYGSPTGDGGQAATGVAISHS